MSQSAERAAKLLLWLSDRAVEHGESDQSLKDIADGTGLDKATAYRLINSLAKFDLIRRDDQTHRYQLGTGAMRLGRAAVDSHALLARCLPNLRSLAEATGETISLSERQGLQCVTIYEIESRQVVRYANTIGRTVPLHVSAGARAVLAFSEEGVVASALATELESYTDLTITEPKKLRRLVDQTRLRGFATSFGERTHGVYSIGAPVLASGGNAAGSISILWPSRGEPVDKQRLRDWPDLLVEATRPINERYANEAV